MHNIYIYIIAYIYIYIYITLHIIYIYLLHIIYIILHIIYILGLLGPLHRPTSQSPGPSPFDRPLLRRLRFEHPEGEPVHWSTNLAHQWRQNVALFWTPPSSSSSTCPGLRGSHPGDEALPCPDPGHSMHHSCRLECFTSWPRNGCTRLGCCLHDCGRPPRATDANRPDLETQNLRPLFSQPGLREQSFPGSKAL